MHNARSNSACEFSSLSTLMPKRKLVHDDSDKRGVHWEGRKCRLMWIIVLLPLMKIMIFQKLYLQMMTITWLKHTKILYKNCYLCPWCSQLNKMKHMEVLIVTAPTQLQHNLNLTQLSWVWHENGFAHHHPPPKLNFHHKEPQINLRPSSRSRPRLKIHPRLDDWIYPI